MMVKQLHLIRREIDMLPDPNVVLSWLDTGSAAVSNGLTIAIQVMSLVLPFL
ncbi:hypothetical protein [Nocardia nova]|uniref:hypothetical protein n=1 Tax=Nocardia nova TaxID=37330 RepID=UPI0033D47D54